MFELTRICHINKNEEIKLSLVRVVTIRSLRDSTKRKYDLGFANHARAFWHSPATLQFMYTDSEGFRFSVQFRNLEWMRPVRAGDMLIVRHQMYTEHREPLKFYEPALRLYFVFDGKNWYGRLHPPDGLLSY